MQLHKRILGLLWQELIQENRVFEHNKKDWFVSKLQQLENEVLPVLYISIFSLKPNVIKSHIHYINAFHTADFWLEMIQ